LDRLWTEGPEKLTPNPGASRSSSDHLPHALPVPPWPRPPGDPEVELFLPSVALGEFAEGFEDADHPVLRVVRELHVLLPIDEETALTYGRLTRHLRGRGELLGANDLWIAASTLRHGLPLVTAAAADFRRVPELELVAYRR